MPDWDALETRTVPTDSFSAKRKRDRTHERDCSRRERIEAKASSTKTQIDCTHCCKKNCHLLYSVRHVEAFRHAMTSALTSSPTTRREFVANRILYDECAMEKTMTADGIVNNSQTAGQKVSRVFHLDHPRSITESMLHMKVDLPTKPTQLQFVCGKYFTWVLQVSNNFIYQPNSSSKRMLVESKPRVAARESPKLYKIISWLLVVASFYLFSPTSSDIYLPFANRTAVWSLFIHEMNESNKSETNCDSESDSENDDSDTKEVSAEENKCEKEHTDNALEKPFCSKQYFCQAWKSDQLQHIKIRKHLRFSLCNTCVELR